MKLEIAGELEREIDARVQSGRYGSAEDVVRAALQSLGQDERRGEFAPGEWDRLLSEGEVSGTEIDGETVFEELRVAHTTSRA